MCVPGGFLEGLKEQCGEGMMVVSGRKYDAGNIKGLKSREGAIEEDNRNS